MPRISPSNPIHRLREIVDARLLLAHTLAPFYAAANLVARQGEDDIYSSLEALPAFRAPWLEDQKLHNEFTTIAINLALAYER